MIKNEGLLSERADDAPLGKLTNVMSYPGAKDWWLTRKETFDVEFANSLASGMRENPQVDPYGLRGRDEK